MNLQQTQLKIQISSHGFFFFKITSKSLQKDTQQVNHKPYIVIFIHVIILGMFGLNLQPHSAPNSISDNYNAP